MMATPEHRFDVLIVGGGPAGLSAAIYLARARRTVAVFDRGRPGRSDWAQFNHNYLGFPNGISIVELGARGRAQAERFGAHFYEAEITELRRDGTGFIAAAGGATVRGRAVVLATGISDRWVTFPGYEEFIGRGMHTCIVCDGYEMADQRVVAVGNDTHAALVARQLLAYQPASVTLVTNSDQVAMSATALDMLASLRIPVVADRIVGARAREPGWFEAVQMAGGGELPLDHLFSLQGAVPNSALAHALGVQTTADGYIEADTEARTNVTGVYAAGDVTRLFSHLVLTAAHEGATAATAISYDLSQEDLAGLDRHPTPAI